jgi:hypothetical protein
MKNNQIQFAKWHTCFRNLSIDQSVLYFFFVFLLVVNVSLAEQVRLSSLDLGHVQQGNGHPGVDRSADDKPLCIAGKAFNHGLSTFAPSVLHIDLHGGSSRFTAQVGINDSGPNLKKRAAPSS